MGSPYLCRKNLALKQTHAFISSSSYLQLIPVSIFSTIHIPTFIPCVVGYSPLSFIMESIIKTIGSTDSKISKSTFGRVFRLDGSGHVSAIKHFVYQANRQQPKERKGSKFVTEIRAGLTTFFTMAYIIAVNVSVQPLDLLLS